MLTYVFIKEIYVRQIVAEQIAGVLQGLQLAAENSDEYLTLLDVLVQFCSDTDQKVDTRNPPLIRNCRFEGFRNTMARQVQL